MAVAEESKTAQRKKSQGVPAGQRSDYAKKRREEKGRHAKID
jgi:hypothetical protein